MKRFLRLVMLLVLVSCVAVAGKDRKAEKSADREKVPQGSQVSSVFYRSTLAMWDTLSIMSGIEHYDDIIALPGGVLWIGGFTNLDEDFAYRSTDNGATWQRRSLISFTLSQGYMLAARDANIALAATWLGDIYRTTDGGANWSPVFNYGSGNGFFNGIKFTGGDSVVAVGDADGAGLCVVKSTDAGATWTRYTNLPTAELGNVFNLATYHQCMDGIGPYLWITTYVGTGTAPRLLRTTDFGATWTSADLILAGGLTNAWRINSINMADLNVGYLIPRQTGAGVRCFYHKTTDGGATWSDTLLIERGTVAVSVKPVPGTQNLLALGWLGNDPRAWWSTNTGGTWGDIAPAARGDGSDLRNASFVNSSLAYVTGLYKALKFTPPGSVGVEPEPTGVPETYSLSQNYPNPFNPATTIRYGIPSSDRVSLKVFNAIGQEVATLIDEDQPTGSYTVRFDGHNLASGVYYYTLRTGSFVSTKMLVLMK